MAGIAERISIFITTICSVCDGDDDPHSRSRALKLVRVARENFTQI
jgi:hypothetical protein